METILWVQVPPMTIKSEKAVLPIMMRVKTARTKVRITCTAVEGTSSVSPQGAASLVMEFSLAPMGVMKSQVGGSPVGHITTFHRSSIGRDNRLSCYMKVNKTIARCITGYTFRKVSRSVLIHECWCTHTYAHSMLCWLRFARRRYPIGESGGVRVTRS